MCLRFSKESKAKLQQVESYPCIKCQLISPASRGCCIVEVTLVMLRHDTDTTQPPLLSEEIILIYPDYAQLSGQALTTRTQLTPPSPLS